LYRRQEFGWFLGALAGGMSSDPDDPSRAREGRHRVPDRAEQVRLRSTLGVVLRLERGHWTQQELADAAGLDRRTIDRLENGQRRPSTVSVWKIARALRPGDSLREQVALDERLCRAAGHSLVYANTRPHVARERVRGELLAAAGGAPVATESDTLGRLILADLAAGAAGADDGDHDD
jgi:transcriptional regulator with XRE-family HTH domain